MSEQRELEVWRKAYDECLDAIYPPENEPSAAIIRTYGDERYQAAIADVVEWLESEATPYPEGSAYSHAANEITRRFGKG